MTRIVRYASRPLLVAPDNRQQPQQELEQLRGDRQAFPVAGLSPRSVLQPPPFANAFAQLARRKRPAAKPMNAATYLRSFVNVAAGARAVNALPQNQGFRNALIIRNASTSAGNLLVGFGYAPTNELDCDIELPPGSYVYQDYVVSQDDVWLFSSAGASVSVTYSVR